MGIVIQPWMIQAALWVVLTVSVVMVIRKTFRKKLR
jgi:hypothetical protein